MSVGQQVPYVPDSDLQRYCHQHVSGSRPHLPLIMKTNPSASSAPPLCLLNHAPLPPRPRPSVSPATPLCFPAQPRPSAPPLSLARLQPND